MKASVVACVKASVETSWFVLGLVWGLAWSFLWGGNAATPDGRKLLLRQVLAVEPRRRDDNDRADGVFGGEDVS